ncbi:MAG TPA: BamA/TamA family outer membrane protein [Flavisolibacter sp.]|nr:BamA/TamA family outer membrane protein [Flavisolibacter sp.]
MRFVRRLACFCAIVLTHGQVAAQEAAPGNALIFSTDAGISPTSDSINQRYTVRNIIIAGNRKTNPNIILRELSFQIDEEYPLEQITKKFKKARQQLMNTGLFTDVTVSLQTLSGYDVYVKIEVLEKWYIWPQPFLRTVDKNFHEWWTDKNRSMDRINYGIRLTHNNFTGRNDKLKINVMNGYTRQIALEYYGLYLDNQLRWSVNGGLSIGQNREVNYMTRDNKPVPIKNNDQFLRTYTSWFAEVSFRPALKTKHTFGIGYCAEDYADTIFKLNPFFSSGSKALHSPELSYKLAYSDVDYIPYPTKGYLAELMIRKKGFGFNDPINLWQLTAKGSGSWPIHPKYFFNLRAVGMLKLPFRQPYVTRQFIGYDDQYLQGYEYYVIDGVAGGFTKASITRQLLNTTLRINSKKFKCLNYIPLKFYAKTFVNAGYVYSKHPGQNEFANTPLYSGGIGLDIVTYNDFVIKIEWSVNRLGENGLYLHRRNNF